MVVISGNALKCASEVRYLIAFSVWQLIINATLVLLNISFYRAFNPILARIGRAASAGSMIFLLNSIFFYKYLVKYRGNSS